MLNSTTDLAAVKAQRFASRKQVSLLIATDGLSQSDAALTYARTLPAEMRASVTVLSVVDHAPIPWGNVDRSLVLDYERELHVDAERRTKAQVARLGEAGWQVEVRYGSPPETIAAVAAEYGARLVLVGLGEHGAAARIFGNETALRLMRICRAPVLAIDAKLKSAPKRLLVAMDFREASIEAARVALDLAAPDATVTVAHVIPWERKEFVPDKWLRDYEAHVTEQLVRIIGWLDRNGDYKMERQILYGRPGPEILACAESLGADLIVSGTHGRSPLSRMLTGETLARVVRGAKRSILVLPASAAFRGFHEHAQQGADSQETEWPAKLEQFSRRNLSRRARLEIDNPAVGAQVEMSGYHFLGASYDPPTKRAQLMFGSPEAGAPHLSRGISNIKSVDVLGGPGALCDTALSIISDDGQTLLLFDRKQEG